MNEKLKKISNLFENKEIRSIWDSEKEEYYFSVVDVIYRNRGYYDEWIEARLKGILNRNLLI